MGVKMKVLEQFISNLQIGEGSAFERLIIKPVFVSTDFALPFLTLEEALQQNVLSITEKDEGGSVPELLVRNKGALDVIVLEGEELRGAKQNRVLNTTIIIPAHSEMVIPVSCVEQGRWGYRSRNFSSGGNVLYPSLRSLSHGSVTSSLRQRSSYDSDQSGIWANIRSKSARMDVDSHTSAMSDILDSSLTPDADGLLQQEFQYQDRQIGFLAYIGGGFAGGDVFGSTDLCAKQLKKLLRGYYLDALDDGVRFPALSAEEILAQVSTARHEQFDAIGKGAEMRFETPKIQGAWKLVGENVSHLSVFPRS